MPDIDSATLEDADVVGSILGEAFHDDPVISYAIGRDGFSDVLYPLAYRAIYARLGHTYLARASSGEPAGCGMWVGPGQSASDVSLGAAVRLSLATLRAGGFRGLSRLLRLGRVSETHHPKQPHYYLNAIGVRASAQGQGLGGTLMRHVLAMADREGVDAYLENSRERNLAFYRRHGFEVTQQIVPLPGGPPLWLMQRTARRVCTSATV